jgi:hypothetical protein
MPFDLRPPLAEAEDTNLPSPVKILLGVRVVIIDARTERNAVKSG